MAERFAGTYVELTPYERLRYRDRFYDPGMPDEMDVTAAPREASWGTEIDIVQEGLPSVIPLDLCYLGWQESLSQLALLVEQEIPDEA
jgi:uncharacterized protein YndB with AHSA1/START domain